MYARFRSDERRLLMRPILVEVHHRHASRTEDFASRGWHFAGIGVQLDYWENVQPMAAMYYKELGDAETRIQYAQSSVYAVTNCGTFPHRMSTAFGDSGQFFVAFPYITSQT